MKKKPYGEGFIESWVLRTDNDLKQYMRMVTLAVGVLIAATVVLTGLVLAFEFLPLVVPVIMILLVTWAYAKWLVRD